MFIIVVVVLVLVIVGMNFDQGNLLTSNTVKHCKGQPTCHNSSVLNTNDSQVQYKTNAQQHEANSMKLNIMKHSVFKNQTSSAHVVRLFDL